MTEPSWLPVARKYLGTTEVTGRAHNPTISRWLRELKAWWTDDEAPWCGVFVAAVLRESGFSVPQHWYRARAYLDFGQKESIASLGSIVVFERGGAGHVGFAVGHDERGRLMVLGGNQSNAVNVQPFEMSRVLGYRWPLARTWPLASPDPLAPRIPLPLIQSGGRAPSRSEA